MYEANMTLCAAKLCDIFNLVLSLECTSYIDVF
jgi:hypothetical protein